MNDIKFIIIDKPDDFLVVDIREIRQRNFSTAELRVMANERNLQLKVTLDINDVIVGQDGLVRPVSSFVMAVTEHADYVGIDTPEGEFVLKYRGDPKPPCVSTFSLVATSVLCDMADHRNPSAYQALSEQDGPEPEFRRGLIEIMTGEPAPHPHAAPFGPVRTFQVAELVDRHGGDLWGEHPKYPKSDWKYEVENDDTFLGYWEWVYCKLDEAEVEGDA